MKEGGESRPDGGPDGGPAGRLQYEEMSEELLLLLVEVCALLM